MFSLITLGLAGAVSAAATLPAPQTIAFSQAPVNVVSCSYTAIPMLSSNAFGGGYTPTLGSLQISFVNSAPVAATDVRFAVTEDGRTQNPRRRRDLLDRHDDRPPVRHGERGGLGARELRDRRRQLRRRNELARE